jgi:hypothetical protein
MYKPPSAAGAFLLAHPPVFRFLPWILFRMRLTDSTVLATASRFLQPVDFLEADLRAVSAPRCGFWGLTKHANHTSLTQPPADPGF